MILTRLSATNFRCFRELELTDLPRRGVIVLLGGNESGKSTLGDILTFALFGRTVQSGAQPNPATLIRWGAAFAEVELECEIPGRGAYRIFREIDRSGEHLAQLVALDSSRVIAGVRRVDRELRALLGYDFRDYVDTVFLADRAPERVGSLAELRATVDRLTGVLACRRAAAVAARQEAELNQMRARVSAAIQREQAVLAPDRAELTLLSAIDDTVAETKAFEQEIEAGHTRLARARERLAQRVEIGRDLDEIARLLRGRDLERELSELEREAHNGLATLPEARAAAGMRLAAARARLTAAGEIKLEIERFAERVAARREEVERKLTTGRSGSLVDELADARLEIARFGCQGRILGKLGLLAVAAGGAAAGILHLPHAWRDFIAYSAPAQPPFGPRLWPGTGPGLELLAAGLVVAIFATARHRRARRRAGVLKVAIDWLHREIGERTAERAFLGSRPAAALLGNLELQRCPDPAVREHAERIVRALPGLLAGGELAPTLEQSESEARAAEGELAAMRQRESALQASLAQVAARRTLAPAGGDLSAAFPRLLRHLSAFHGLPGLAAQRSQAFAELLAVDEIGSGLPAPRILSALAGVREALPGPAALAAEVERLATEETRRREQLARVEERAAALRSELEARTAEFAAQRAARAESDRLNARRSALDAELGRESLARQLLDETAQRLRRRVAPRLATALEAALGELTAGRYSRVRVPEELTIQLHSAEKRALVSAEELSAGTRMQMELALRLACTELFLELRAPQGVHFMFLDEPIEGLDPERARSFVHLLHQYAERCGQVFLAGTERELAESGAPVIRLAAPGASVRRLEVHRALEDAAVAMPVEA